MPYEDKTEYYKAILSAWRESENRREAHQKAVVNLGYPLRYGRFMDSIRYARTKGIDVPDLPQIETGTDWNEVRMHVSNIDTAE